MPHYSRIILNSFYDRLFPKLFWHIRQNNFSLCVANYVYIITFANYYNIAYIYLVHNILRRLVHAVTTL